MAARYCPGCGQPIEPDATRCEKCGISVSPAPLPSRGPPPPPPRYDAPLPRLEESPDLRWVFVWVVVIGVVVIIVLAVAIALATSIQVTAINFTSSDDACGTNGGTSAGFTTGGGGSVHDIFSVRNANLSYSCSIDSVNATTPGFGVSGANVPLTIPAGGGESLSFTIIAPHGFYKGTLTIDLE